jgi:hypothetical protein
MIFTKIRFKLLFGPKWIPAKKRLWFRDILHKFQMFILMYIAKPKPLVLDTKMKRTIFNQFKKLDDITMDKDD